MISASIFWYLLFVQSEISISYQMSLSIRPTCLGTFPKPLCQFLQASEWEPWHCNTDESLHHSTIMNGRGRSINLLSTILRVNNRLRMWENISSGDKDCCVWFLELILIRLNTLIYSQSGVWVALPTVSLCWQSSKTIKGIRGTKLLCIDIIYHQDSLLPGLPCQLAVIDISIFRF